MTTATPIDIGDRKQLFLDETFFAARDGVNLTVHSPVDRGIAIQADQPWESTAACNWCVVVHDPKLGHVKMYYEAYRELPRKSNGQPNFDRRMCCAISHDGVRWEKPDLGIYEFEGSTWSWCEQEVVADGIRYTIPLYSFNDPIRLFEREPHWLLSDDRQAGFRRLDGLLRV